MLLKTATLTFVGLMILGATCEDPRIEPEIVAGCLDPRRIDFDNGVRTACETARKLTHPVETIASAFERRYEIGSERPEFQVVRFSTSRLE